MEQHFGRTPSPFASELPAYRKRLPASQLEEPVENHGKIADSRVFTRRVQQINLCVASSRHSSRTRKEAQRSKLNPTATAATEWSYLLSGMQSPITSQINTLCQATLTLADEFDI
jgi:hypothetical protein